MSSAKSRSAAALSVVAALSLAATPPIPAIAGENPRHGTAARAGTGASAAQNAFGKRVDAVRRHHPALFSTAHWEPKKNSGTIVLLASATPAQRKSVTALLGKHRQEAQFTGLLNAEDMRRQIREVADTIHATAQVDTLTVTPSRDARSIEVRSNRDHRPAVTRWQAAPRRDAKPAVPVRYQVDAAMRSTRQVDVIGGADLQAVGSGADACTAAFTVVYKTGVRGLLTAGHCSDALSYGHNAGWLSPGMGGRSDVGDLQWHSTTTATGPSVVWSRGKQATVVGVASLHPGFAVNRYGRNSEDLELSIDVPDGDITLGGTRYQHMALTLPGCTSRHGDSGGPYWTQATRGVLAAGIHTGMIWTGEAYRCVLTPASQVSNAWFGDMTIQTG